MTNETIILNESFKLMADGILKGSGEFVEINGKQVELPEEIHTFNGWKARGFMVKKGEKAKASFVIWKCAKKTKEAEDEDGNKVEINTSKMFHKMSYFFTADQVKALA